MFLGVTISGLLSDLGYAGLALLMVAETVFPPIPSEVVLPLAGYLVQQGDFTFAGALVASTAGSLIGALALEEAARSRRPPVRRALCPLRARPSRGGQAGTAGLKGTSRSSPGRTMRAVPAGTSRQTPGRSPSGSDTITRDSSEKIEKRSSSG